MSALTQLQALINAVGADLIMDHLTGAPVEAVSIGAQLSKDSDGQLTEQDTTLLDSL